MTFRLPPGGIVGVIGPNGAGKTTLFRMIIGEEQPDSGTLRVGATVELGYVDQNRDALAADNTVFEEISGGHETLEMGGRKINARAYVSRFNFRGPDQEKKVGDLSGGERNRVHLAKLLRRGSNVLLLDEPTNDLDVDTLRALEEAILNYAGCVVVISHDRWFLDRIATHILAFEGDAYVHWCEGNYRDLRAASGRNDSVSTPMNRTAFATKSCSDKRAIDRFALRFQQNALGHVRRQPQTRARLDAIGNISAGGSHRVL